VEGKRTGERRNVNILAFGQLIPYQYFRRLPCAFDRDAGRDVTARHGYRGAYGAF
jgi:hypothetical protein